MELQKNVNNQFLSEVQREIIIKTLKTELTTIIWEKKIKEALQWIGVINKESSQELVVNFLFSKKIDTTNLPKEIDWISVEYRKVHKTKFL